MPKEKTFRYHQTEINNRELADGRYQVNVVMRDWDDDQAINLTFNVPNPAIEVGSLSIRTLALEDTEEPPTGLIP